MPPNQLPRIPYLLSSAHLLAQNQNFSLTGGEHGHTRNIYVPDELRDEVAAGVAAYRRYRELGQEIAESNARRSGLENKQRRRR